MGVSVSDMMGSPDLTVDDRIKPDASVLAWLCCSSVTGIPTECKLLPITEQHDYLDMVQGNWIVMPQKMFRRSDRTNAFVNGNVVIVTGGIVE